MPEYRYRCVKVTTTDYGSGPSAGKVSVASLAVIPDGSHWQSKPATIDILVPIETRPGSIYRVVIEEETNA